MFTQFQGAFSDNALRWLVIFPVLRLGHFERCRQGRLRLARLAAVRRAVPAVFHRRRLDGGPLQQALGDDRREARGNRHHALRRAGPGMGKPGAATRRDLPDGRSQHVLRPGEIRRSCPRCCPSRNFRRATAFSSFSPSSASFSAPSPVVGWRKRWCIAKAGPGCCLAVLAAVGFLTSLGIRQSARRRSRQEIQLQHPRGNLEQPARHESRPRPLARQLGQHRFLLRRHAGADQSRAFRPESLPPETHRTGLAPSRAQPRHRRGQHAGRQAFTRPHRIRVDSAGCGADGLGGPVARLAGDQQARVHGRLWRC